jgi:hypothetical protein
VFVYCRTPTRVHTHALIRNSLSVTPHQVAAEARSDDWADELGDDVFAGGGGMGWASSGDTSPYGRLHKEFATKMTLCETEKPILFVAMGLWLLQQLWAVYTLWANISHVHRGELCIGLDPSQCVCSDSFVAPQLTHR